MSQGKQAELLNLFRSLNGAERAECLQQLLQEAATLRKTAAEQKVDIEDITETELSKESEHQHEMHPKSYDMVPAHQDESSHKVVPAHWSKKSIPRDAPISVGVLRRMDSILHELPTGPVTSTGPTFTMSASHSAGQKEEAKPQPTATCPRCQKRYPCPPHDEDSVRVCGPCRAKGLPHVDTDSSPPTPVGTPAPTGHHRQPSSPHKTHRQRVPGWMDPFRLFRDATQKKQQDDVTTPAPKRAKSQHQPQREMEHSHVHPSLFKKVYPRPHAEVGEFSDAYVIKASMPGYSSDSVHLAQGDGFLSLKASPPQDAFDPHPWEQCFRLPSDALVDQLRARFHTHRNMLIITVPRHRPRYTTPYTRRAVSDDMATGEAEPTPSRNSGPTSPQEFNAFPFAFSHLW